MIPGVTEMDLPKPSGQLLSHAAAEGDGATANPAKRANKSKTKAELTPERICSLLEASNPETGALAQHYYALSACAREAGVEGMAACALLAFKMREVDTIDPEDVCELDEDVSGAIPRILGAAPTRPGAPPRLLSLHASRLSTPGVPPLAGPRGVRPRRLPRLRALDRAGARLPPRGADTVHQGQGAHRTQLRVAQSCARARWYAFLRP